MSHVVVSCNFYRRSKLQVVSTVVSGILFANFSTVEYVPTLWGFLLMSLYSFWTGTFLNNYDDIKKARNLGNTVDSRKTSKKNARYYSRDYSTWSIVMTYLWKEVYPQCASLTWGLTLSYEMLCSYRESYIRLRS